MTEERVTYTTQLEARIAELEAELTGVIEGHTAATELTAKIDLAKDRMIAVRDARIAELEQALHDTTAQLATATETIARQEQDNKRLRHLDAMPYWSIVQVANEPQLWSLPAVREIKAWVDAQDGAA